MPTASSFLGLSASSVQSTVWSTSEYYASAMTGNTIGRPNRRMSPAKMIVNETRATGRTLFLSPMCWKRRRRMTDPQPVKKVLITQASLASVTSRSTLSSLLGTSASASVRPILSASSIHSHTTVRRSLAFNRTPTKSPASRFKVQSYIHTLQLLPVVVYI